MTAKMVLDSVDAGAAIVALTPAKTDASFMMNVDMAGFEVSQLILSFKM